MTIYVYLLKVNTSVSQISLALGFGDFIRIWYLESASVWRYFFNSSIGSLVSLQISLVLYDSCWLKSIKIQAWYVEITCVEQTWRSDLCEHAGSWTEQNQPRLYLILLYTISNSQWLSYRSVYQEHTNSIGFGSKRPITVDVPSVWIHFNFRCDVLDS